MGGEETPLFGLFCTPLFTVSTSTRNNSACPCERLLDESAAAATYQALPRNLELLVREGQQIGPTKKQPQLWTHTRAAVLLKFSNMFDSSARTSANFHTMLWGQAESFFLHSSQQFSLSSYITRAFA